MASNVPSDGEIFEDADCKPENESEELLMKEKQTEREDLSESVSRVEKFGREGTPDGGEMKEDDESQVKEEQKEDDVQVNEVDGQKEGKEEDGMIRRNFESGKGKLCNTHTHK